MKLDDLTLHSSTEEAETIITIPRQGNIAYITTTDPVTLTKLRHMENVEIEHICKARNGKENHITEISVKVPKRQISFRKQLMKKKPKKETT